MGLLVYLSVSFLFFAVAYRLYGRYLERAFALRSTEDTPAHAMRDGLDYEPAPTSYLLPQHFSAIAAAGPIVGPILAGLYFGWGPAWLWIVLGAIVVGGVHDFTALVASVRHRSRSIAEIVRQYMNLRAYLLFLVFIWFALIYVIIAFTDVTAETFVRAASSTEAQAPGPAVATSSVLYLGLAVAMGFVLRHTALSHGPAKLVFLPLVVVAIAVGPLLPFDLGAWLGLAAPEELPRVQQIWGYVLLAYCFFAAIMPVWLLLQPRGDLGGSFLYAVMILAVLGIVCGGLFGGQTIAQPFFKGWEAKDAFGEAAPLFPILFVTVACGACSGFHSIVASGTTSKQLRCERDARPIAYGGMLLEGFLACISLATYMVFAGQAGKPDVIYANGIAEFGTRLVGVFGVPAEQARAFLLQFALLCFATFVFDTLDACTRLARYVLMELLGWTTRPQALAATALSLALPLLIVSLPPAELGGKPLALWRVFWGIFGSSNQLLAALTLLGVTVWLARRRMPYWLTLGPTLLMMLMSLWSLVVGIEPYLALWRAHQEIEAIRHVQFAISLSLIGLSVWLIVEALITWWTMIQPPSRVELAEGVSAAG